MKKIISFIYLISLFCFFSIDSARAVVSFKIKGDEIPKSKILIYGFDEANSYVSKDASKIVEQIRENLTSTALFDVISHQDYIKLFNIKNKSSFNISRSNLSINTVPDFNKYASVGIDALLIADVGFNASESKLELKVRLWDILDERQMFGKYYLTGQDRYKKMSNMISNKVFESITGEKSGHFDSQIAYIAESGNPRKRVKRIALMDFDGGNFRYLTDGEDLVLTPSFSKNPGELFFLRYFKNRPQIFYLDIEKKIISKLSKIKKTTFAPYAHPQNPNLLLFSIIDSRGASNIYEMNRYSDRITKLTRGRAINTTPSYSPDGKKIIFSSDRSGTEKIYVMNYDGSNTKKISNGRGSYSKPIWSPDGSLIAFTRVSKNRFYIGVMTPDGKNERVITSAYLVEGARWSPNGRYLIYSKKTSPYGKGSIPKIYIMDIVTGYERMLPTPDSEGATDPDWGLSWES